MQGSFREMKSRSTRLALLFSILLALTLFLVAALPQTSSATQDEAQSDGSQKRSRSAFVPGQALVRYRSEQAANRKTLQTLSSSDGRQFSIQLERFAGSDIVPGLRLAHMAAEDTMAAVEALKAQPDVLYAEPNYRWYRTTTTPNDPCFPVNILPGCQSLDLYGLNKIGAPLAWDTIRGSRDTAQAGFGTPRIVVGVIDEGIDTVHEDLVGNIWTNPGEIAGNGVDDDSNGFIDDVNGYNFFDNTGTIPKANHATHVAGTIGATGNNGIGVVGVNWQVGLMSLKFLDSSGSTADAIRASAYGKQMRDLWLSSGGTLGANVRVLNNSWGPDRRLGNGLSPALQDVITSVGQSGILFVVSAGNDAIDNDVDPGYPASYDLPNLISVASTDRLDALSSFSNFGASTITMGAPGSGILSTTINNTYSSMSGTSMAAPHVSGAAALLLAANPNLTMQQLKSLLIYNGDPLASLSGKTLTGRRLNVGNSIQALAENDVTPPGTVGNLHLNSQTGRSLNVGWTASGDDGALGQASSYKLTFTDATSGAVVFLKSVIPVASGVTQAVDVKLPYRHINGTLTLREFDNVGNEGVPATLAISVPPNAGDPYLISLGSAVALSTGGVGLATNCDDCSKTQALPFTFSFFGENFSSVKVTSNGALYFSTPLTNDSASSVAALTQFKMVAGLWDDLRTDHGAGNDIYVVTPDASRIIFRWQAVTFGDDTPATEFPVNFEIELRSNGTILTRYGAGQSAPINTNLFPVVGISAGEPETYVVPSHTSETVSKSLTNAQQVTFLPRSLTNALTVASLNPTTGVSITVSPIDAGDQGNGTTLFTRGYLPNTIVNLTAPATANGNNFLKWQKDGLDFAATAATSVTMDAAHAMTAVYVTPRTLTIASILPASGVNITVTPNDNGGLSDGTTQFTRTYNDGTVVSLTAPANVNGNPFKLWQRDGVDWADTPATSLTIDANRTMTAIYFNAVQFSVPQFPNVPEAETQPCSNPACGSSATITVTRGGSTATPASVDYTTSDGVAPPNATQKGDYIISAGRLNFAVGETSKTFKVFIVDDVFQEGIEKFQVVLSNPVGTSLGVRSVADVPILDNDLFPPTTNPLDNSDARFFVREHYVDFLNREPDAGGLAFWTDQITSCGADNACKEVRRINVSAAFFKSIEFQETGYLVERMYKVAYGDATGTSTYLGTHTLPVPVIRYLEFLRDTQQIGKDVVVGQTGWEQQLESNKVAFALDFVTRTRFTSAYATSLTPTAFVNQLFAKAGISPTSQELQDAINEFGGAGNTADTAARGRALRRIAENPSLNSAENNKAFVLMQFIGYLRRDPNSGPDTDYTGYDFWLTKLNQFNGNFVNAEMVKAFLVSGEYRGRFGPP